MPADLRRKSPDELLRELHFSEEPRKRGYLKIVLGYASGVGKSLRMLDEARRRRERGQDVVVGAIQRRVPAEVAEILQKLEVVPLHQMQGGAAIDVARILKRAPAVCFIDGLAYDNPPGSRNPCRWQDVRELLEAGIKVVASVNIQYVDELREDVERVTGKRIAETVPAAFIRSADEIEMIDAPPEETIDRSGETLPGDRTRRQQLAKLRELTLVLAADVVDRQLEQYLAEHGIAQHLGTHERILICITPRSNIQPMISAARTISDRFHGDFLVAYVNQPNLSPADRASLEEKLQLAQEAGARLEVLEGDDPVTAILDFARARGITQLFIGHSQRAGVRARLWGNPVDRLIENSIGMDVRVFPQ